MDLIDLADPIRLVILLLPERYRGPAAALITALVGAQGIAASIVSRLPLSAAQHPRWGRVVRALHWYSLLRFRDEKGTTKAIGADLAPRVTVAPLPSRPLVVTLDAAMRPEAPAPFDPTARQTILPEVAAQIASETLPRESIAPGVAHDAQMFAPSFDPSLTQDVTDAARVVRSVVASSGANDPSTPNDGR